MLIFFYHTQVACCNAIKFSWLIEFYFFPISLVDWLMLLMFLLQNSPKLKTLTIDNVSFPSSLKISASSFDELNIKIYCTDTRTSSVSHFPGTSRVLFPDACCLI